MSILGVNNYLTTAYQYANKSQKATTNGAGFTEKLQTGKGIGDKQDTEMFAGDMVVSQPPDYNGFTYNSNISNKSKKEMSLDEYKQWFMNEMSKIPVSGYYRASFTGSMVITEKAFEKMKSDPEWEKTVLNMLREGYSVNGLPQRSYCMQVIGASPEECHGYSVPMNSSNSLLVLSGNKESWWQKRYEKMEEVIKKQAIKAQEKAAEQRTSEQQRCLNEQLASSRRLQDFLMENAQIGQRILEPSTVSEAAGATTYKGIMDAYSDGITGKLDYKKRLW